MEGGPQLFKLDKSIKMVEASQNNTNAGNATLNIAPVEKANALGLFRESELDVHVDVVLGAYIAESEKIA